MYRSIPQLAKLLGMGERTIYRRIADGTIPHIRVGRTIRVREEDIRKALGNGALLDLDAK